MSHVRLVVRLPGTLSCSSCPFRDEQHACRAVRAPDAPTGTRVPRPFDDIDPGTGRPRWCPLTAGSVTVTRG